MKRIPLVTLLVVALAMVLAGCGLLSQKTEPPSPTAPVKEVKMVHPSGIPVLMYHKIGDDKDNDAVIREDLFRLDLFRRNAHVFGQSCGAQVPNELDHVLLGGPAHEEEVAFYIFQVRHFAPVDSVGIHYDQALLGLPEDLRQAHGRQRAAAQHIAEGAPRSHRRQLVRVSHQNQALSLGDGPQKAVQQPDIHHGHLVHNHRVGL